MNNQLSPDLHRLLDEYLSWFSRLRLRKDYRGSQALIEEYTKIDNWIDANNFFETYGVGNKVFVVENPFERVHAYELLLYILKSYDNTKYSEIHKGTPYYFIAWTAYQTANFEKALFYMDAAVSEDLRIFKERGRKATPALKFFLLEEAQDTAGFFTLHIEINSAIQKTLGEFSSSSEVKLQKQNFIGKFIKPILFGDKKYRSVITALYGFFLEHEAYTSQIFLRSSSGGSIEPFLNHLFKGARILESILEIKSSKPDLFQKITDLNAKLNIAQKRLEEATKLGTLEEAKKSFDKLSGEDASFQDCNFVPSYIIRNATSHSLIWPDEFETIELYLTLYNRLVNSILWSVEKVWVENKTSKG